ncbi:MAG: phosphohydrolase [Gammaproteobacteria bacterium]|nr:phosphohydrolase [Gammaproteobacteria bacterium]
MRISNLQQLREIYGEAHPATAGKKSATLIEKSIDFITKSPFIILSTASAAGVITCSPKGDAPGFVYVQDKKTIFIPDRPGNKLIDGHKNIIENPHIGLIFFVPNTRETLRINGNAELRNDHELLNRFEARGRPASLVTKITVEESFFHCGKAIIRSNLWNPDSWEAPKKISFGEMLVGTNENKKKGLIEKAKAKFIDIAIENDYKKNL